MESYDNVYQCNACSLRHPCVLSVFQTTNHAKICPLQTGNTPKWARLVPEESAQTGLQQLKQAIAAVKENVSIIEQRACV